mgnify:CR=1 FL=1
MRQRLGIAEAMIHNPNILILDEPTAGLDPEGVDKVLDILNNLNKEGMSIVISSHDIEMVNQFADKIFVLYHGQIIASGDKHQIFSDKELLKKAHLKAPITTEILYKLKEKGFMARLTPVLAVDVADEVGQLQVVLTKIKKAGINIEYVYSMKAGGDGATIIIRTSDLEKTEEVLKA